jgi:hypothetical protein
MEKILLTSIGDSMDKYKNVDYDGKDQEKKKMKNHKILK